MRQTTARKNNSKNRRNFMSEQRQKLADLPQNEKEQLIKEAQEVGLNSTQIANWYVDTLRAKIDEKKQKQDAAAPVADATEKTEDQAADTKSDDAADEPVIDPKAEAAELDKDVEPAAPKAPRTQNKAQKTAEPEVVTICHICRSKVVNGKCTGCGFEISKR